MKHSKIIITIGIPASGKSTWAAQIIKENPFWVKVSRDDFRYMLKEQGVCENKIETLISDLVETTVIKALNKGQNVIIDATHVKLSYINEVIKAYQEYADIEFKLFDEPIEICISRDKNRIISVGELVIKKMFDNLQILKSNFDFAPILKNKNRSVIKPNFKSELRSAVCFDIDGTLALMGKRSPYEWNKIHIDECNDIVAEQISFHKSMNRKIIILSGRDGACKELTEMWLKDQGIEYDLIFMRSPGDMRKDSIVKKEIYENYIKDRYNVLCIYDDRLQVVKMWYELGIFVFNVNQGMKEF